MNVYSLFADLRAGKLTTEQVQQALKTGLDPTTNKLTLTDKQKSKLKAKAEVMRRIHGE